MPSHPPPAPPLLDQIAQLRLQLDAARAQLTLIGGQPDTWAVPAEPKGVTEVWDQRGRRWFTDGPNSWWADHDGDHLSWRRLVVNEGPLHRHPPAEVNHG